MTATNHSHSRGIQQDARAWAEFTGTKYTAALRQMTSPLAQGFLGERVSARDLIAVLHDHDVIGAFDDGEFVLGDNGMWADEPFTFNGRTDFIELALIMDMLRMFTPTGPGETPDVGSYTLKHTAERFLAPHCCYVSNGRLIWAAAALGLDIVEMEGGGPNVLVGVSEREHHYLWRLTQGQDRDLRGHHYRPAGLPPLQTALERYAAGEPPEDRWVRPVSTPLDAPFHVWLRAQAGRDDRVGDFATDYAAGVEDSDHRIAEKPDDLLAILHEASPSLAAYDAGVAAIAEWMATNPTTEPVRTELISSDTHEVAGYGAGPGDVERYEYRCPCGAGAIVEEHDNTPGFREHDVWINCGKCREEWNFAEGRSAHSWGLEPTAVGSN